MNLSTTGMVAMSSRQHTQDTEGLTDAQDLELVDWVHDAGWHAFKACDPAIPGTLGIGLSVLLLGLWNELNPEFRGQYVWAMLLVAVIGGAFVGTILQQFMIIPLRSRSWWRRQLRPLQELATSSRGDRLSLVLHLWESSSQGAGLGVWAVQSEQEHGYERLTTTLISPWDDSDIMRATQMLRLLDEASAHFRDVSLHVTYAQGNETLWTLLADDPSLFSHLEDLRKASIHNLSLMLNAVVDAGPASVRHAASELLDELYLGRLEGDAAVESSTPGDPYRGAGSSTTGRKRSSENLVFDLVNDHSWTYLSVTTPPIECNGYLRIWFLMPLGLVLVIFVGITMSDLLSAAIDLCHSHCGSLIPPGWGNPWPTIASVKDDLFLGNLSISLLAVFVWGFIGVPGGLGRFQRRWVRRTSARIHRAAPSRAVDVIVRVRREASPRGIHGSGPTQYYLGFAALDERAPTEPLFAFDIDASDLEGKRSFPGSKLLDQVVTRGNGEHISLWVACMEHGEMRGLTSLDLSALDLSRIFDRELPEACLQDERFLEITTAALKALAGTYSELPATVHEPSLS